MASCSSITEPYALSVDTDDRVQPTPDAGPQLHSTRTAWASASKRVSGRSSKSGRVGSCKYGHYGRAGYCPALGAWGNRWTSHMQAGEFWTLITVGKVWVGLTDRHILDHRRSRHVRRASVRPVHQESRPILRHLARSTAALLGYHAILATAK